MCEVSNHLITLSVLKNVFSAQSHQFSLCCFHCNDDAVFSECHPSCLTSPLLQNAENASHLNGRKSLNLSSRYFHDSE